MNIAIVHHKYAKKGGMESYLFDMIRGFGAQNDQVTVITYRKDKNAPVYPYCSVEDRGSFVQKLLPQAYKKFYFMCGINRRFDKGKYDLSLSFTRTATQDMVVCGGTHRGFLYYMNKRARLKDRIEIYFEQKSYLETPRIVAHSNLLRDEIINLYGIDAAKITMLFPPIDTKKFHYGVRQQRSFYREKFAIDDRKTTLLFPSTGHKRKGWFELVEALKLLPQSQFELLVAGNQKLATNQPQNIRQLGFIDDMPALYAAVDFTILPSYYEPFGLVIPESIQCGTPVIISDRVGAKDLVTQDEGIIFSEITPQAIAQAILMARARCFNIVPNFAEIHGLTVEKHIKAIINN